MALFDQKNYSEKVLNLSDFDASLKRALRMIFQWFSLWRSEIKLSMNDENTFFYSQQVSADWIRIWWWWWWKVVIKMMEPIRSLIINHDGSWPIKYHFQNLCILREKRFFSSPISLRLWPCVIQNHTMTNERAALDWFSQWEGCTMLIRLCVAILWERMRMHTVNSLHMINNLFCNKGRRSIAQVLNQNFSEKKDWSIFDKWFDRLICSIGYYF